MKDSPWNVLAHWLKYLYSIISFAAYFPVPAVTCTFFCHSVPFLSLVFRGNRPSKVYNMVIQRHNSQSQRQKSQSPQHNLSSLSDGLFHSAIALAWGSLYVCVWVWVCLVGGASFSASTSLLTSHSLSGFCMCWSLWLFSRVRAVICAKTCSVIMSMYISMSMLQHTVLTYILVE